VRCPKCRAEVPDTVLDCTHCGIVFTKYREREEAVPLDIPERAADVDADRPGLRMLLRGIESPTAAPAALGRGLFLALLTIWTITQASRTVSVEGSGSVMHLPNLVFHEAGHILFLPLGRFMTVLGGSLTQVLVPLVCAGAFLWQTRDAFGAAIAIWWAGQSLTDVATYINDARALQLVLLGGQTGAEVEGHDWEYLLNAMGVSRHDHAIALVVHTIGNVLMIAALVWAATIVFNQVRGRTVP
jgi:hypothetical protein